MQFHGRAVRYDTSQVGRGLYQTLHRLAHRLHTVGASNHGLNQLLGNSLLDHLGGSSNLLSLDLDRILDTRELGNYHINVVGNHLLELVPLRSLDHNRSLSLARNCVAQTATINRAKQQLLLFLNGIDQTEHQLISVSALQDDLDTRVTTLQALDSDLGSTITLSGSSLSLIFESGACVQTTCATNIQFTLGLRIEVQQNVALQQAALQTECTVHTRLLSCSEQSLDSAVLDILRLQNSHNRRYTDTVIRAERRAVSSYPIAVDVSLDSVLLEIEYLIAILLGNHIDVSLQNDTLAILHTLGCGFANQYVVSLVLHHFQALLLSKSDDVSTNRLLVERGVRYLA